MKAIYSTIWLILGIITAAGALSAPALAQNESPLETVKVSGFGKTIAEAREDALRQAIQQVVGVYVDSKRLVELKITDRQLHQKLEEHIISYSNAYVDKVEVLGVSEDSGFIKVDLKVTVYVRKLVDRLNAIRLPVFQFDADSAKDKLSTALDEREKAYRLYKSTVLGYGKLIRFEIKHSQLDLATPAMPDSVWLRLDVDYVIDGEQIRRWKEVFSTISNVKYSLRGLWKESMQIQRRACQHGLRYVGGRSSFRPGDTGYHESFWKTVQSVCQVTGRSRDYYNVGCKGRAFPERDNLLPKERIDDIGRRTVDVVLLDSQKEIIKRVRFGAENAEVRTLNRLPHPPTSASPFAPSNWHNSARPVRNQVGFAQFCSARTVSLGLSPRFGTPRFLILPNKELRLPGRIWIQISEDAAHRIAKIGIQVSEK